MNYKTIKIEKNLNFVNLILNRPEVHNALNEELISEFLNALEKLKEEDFRVLILRGEGKSFCSGGDISYLKKVSDMDYQTNLEEAKKLADLMYSLYFFPKPTIAIGQGNIFGGGIGLISCCDFSFCDQSSVFSFSEVKLGIIPAVISPYVIRKIGISKSKELFLSGRRFFSNEAEKIGLITKSVEKEKIEEEVNNLISELLKNSPNAMKNIKILVEENIYSDLKLLKIKTSEFFAKIRSEQDAKEGFKAFLEKRKPNWYRE